MKLMSNFDGFDQTCKSLYSVFNNENVSFICHKILETNFITDEKKAEKMINLFFFTNISVSV